MNITQSIQSLEFLGLGKKTNSWVLENSGNEPELFPSIRRRKLTHSGHALRYEGDRLEKDVMIDAQQQVHTTQRKTQKKMDSRMT